MSSPPAIRTEGLARHFGPVRALDGLTLQVPAGAVFGFLGPNGSGKTTTIRLLLGLLRPTAGRAEVLGFDTSTQPDQVRERTGVLLDHHGLYEHMSAAENLELWARIWRISLKEREPRIKGLLEHIGLWERRLDRVGGWSHGMKKRLALARALLPRPGLLLLDEPTAGLDVTSATAVREDLASLAARDDTTVFLTTHNMAEAEHLCGQVAVIRAGKLVAVGSPDELRARAGRPRLEVVGRGFTAEVVELIRQQPYVATAVSHDKRLSVELKEVVDPAPLVTLLVNRGVMVEEVRRGSASLEEVFLALMEEEGDEEAT